MISLIDLVAVTILAFGFWSSYIDIKYGKIKNYIVLLLLLSGLLINIFVTKTMMVAYALLLPGHGLKILIGFLFPHSICLI